MANRWGWSAVVFPLVLLAANPSSAASMVVFDFENIQSSSKKGPRASDIEAYMEDLFGANLTVSSNTVASGSRPSVANLRVLGMPSDSLGASNSFLKIGKGKGSGIVVDFGDNPINSFSVDFQLFKKAKTFAIVADGVTINQQTLSKAQRKSGMVGHQSAYYFDEPVHTLQFVGLKKKSFMIDNLVINIPLDAEGDVSFNSADNATAFESFSNLSNFSPAVFNTANVDQLDAAAAVPEPGSVFLVAFGIIAMFAAKQRLQ